MCHSTIPTSSDFIIWPKPSRGWSYCSNWPRTATCLVVFSQSEYLSAKQRLADDEAFTYFFQVALALEYLHARRIVHRDLKLDNLLLDKHGNVKLCDFGLATTLSDDRDLRSTYCGTLAMMAPELINDQKYGAAVDIWSLGNDSSPGLILLQMLDPQTAASIPKQIDRPALSYIIAAGFRDHEQFSPPLKELLTKMLTPDPYCRWNIKQVLDSDWMAAMAVRFDIVIADYRLANLHPCRPAKPSPPTDVHLKPNGHDERPAEGFRRSDYFDQKGLSNGVRRISDTDDDGDARDGLVDRLQTSLMMSKPLVRDKVESIDVGMPAKNIAGQSLWGADGSLIRMLDTKMTDGDHRHCLRRDFGDLNHQMGRGLIEKNTDRNSIHKLRQANNEPDSILAGLAKLFGCGH